MMTDNTPVDLFWCENCKKWVDAILKQGYESGPFPTAYEDYDLCPTCGQDVTHELEVKS